MFKATEYDYHAWITNIGEHELRSSKNILKYRKRSDGENFIKELKGGFDLRHYPCQKLLANRAYGLIAVFADTMLRFVSLMRNPQRPHFAKLIRHLLIHVPVQVVRHAGIVTFNFARRHYQEVQRLTESLLQMQFD